MSSTRRAPGGRRPARTDRLVSGSLAIAATAGRTTSHSSTGAR